MELSLQRGTLQHVLESVLLLLRLSESCDKNQKLNVKCEEDVKQKKPPDYDVIGGEGGFPLVPFLKRLGSIPTPPSPQPGARMADTVCGLFVCIFVIA